MNRTDWDAAALACDCRAQAEADYYNRPEGDTEVDMNQYAGSESKYLKAADLQGKNIKVKIEGVEIVEFESDDGTKQEKPSLKLAGKEKQVVCNPTSVNELIVAFGDDSDNWIGKEIGLSTKHYASLGKDGIVIQAMKDFVDDDLPF